MTLPELMENLKKNWIVSAALCIVVGLILLFWPEATLLSVCYTVGGFSIAAGVIRIVRYFRQDHTYPVIFQSDLAVGFLALALGLFMVTSPKTVTGLIPTLFAVIIIGFGIANILRALDAKNAGFPRWGILLALAVLTIVLGWVILLGPFEALATTVSLVGGCLIYEGVADIVTVLLVGKRIEAWRGARRKTDE